MTVPTDLRKRRFLSTYIHTRIYIIGEAGEVYHTLFVVVVVGNTDRKDFTDDCNCCNASPTCACLLSFLPLSAILLLVLLCFFLFFSAYYSVLTHPPSTSIHFPRYREDSQIVRQTVCRLLLNPALDATITSLSVVEVVDRGHRCVPHTTLCSFLRVCRITYLCTVLRVVWVDRDVLRCMAKRSRWSKALVCLVGAASKLVRSLCGAVSIGRNSNTSLLYRMCSQEGAATSLSQSLTPFNLSITENYSYRLCGTPPI